MGRPYWGQGYCTEASQALVHFAFQTLQLNRVFAYVMTTNLGSRRVLEKNGLIQEGILRGHVFKWGQFVDLALYATLHSDPRPE